MDIYDSIQKANEERKDIVKSFFGNESTPELVKRVEGDIEKGKRANIGEIRIYGGIPYKKVSATGNTNKDWVRVKDSEGKAIESEKKNFDRPYLRDINLDGDIKYLQSHIDSIKSDLKLEEKHQILKDSDLEEMRYAIGYLENKIKSKEKEIKDPIDDVVSTDMEKKVLKNLIDQLYAEPGFSDVGVKDLASETKLSVNEVKGVIGSLTKKGIVSVGDKDFGGLIYLNHKYYYLHPEWGKQSNVKEDKNYKVRQETDKAYKLEKDGILFWVQKRWVDKNGNLTKSGIESFEEAIKSKKKFEEDSEYIFSNNIKFLGYSNSGNAVKLSININNGIRASDIEFYVPKETFELKENKVGIKQGMLNQKIKEIENKNRVVKISSLDVVKETDKAYGISSYVEDFHTEKEINHIIWVPKSMSKKNDDGSLNVYLWMIDNAIEENKSYHRHGAYQYVTLGGGIRNGYTDVPLILKN